jgi:hypothetical protein
MAGKEKPENRLQKNTKVGAHGNGGWRVYIHALLKYHR